MRAARALLGLAALMVAAGCADSTRPCGAVVCDIRAPDCQRRVGELAACLRGVEPVMVPVRVIPFSEYLNAAVNQTFPPDQVEHFARSVEGLSLLLLAPAGLTLRQAAGDTAWAAAYYSMDDRSITIVDRGEPMSSVDSVSLLVHEYTHALQDATMGINAFLDPAATFDWSLAAQSVIEGEAVLVNDLAELALFDYPPDRVAWPRVFGGWHGRTRSRYHAESRVMLLADLHFIYPFGTWLVHQAWTAKGWDGVRSLYQAPATPTATRQVLAGFGAPAPAGGAWTESLGDQAMPALPDAYQLIDADTVGSFPLEAFLARLGPQTGAIEAAQRLRGDVLSIQYDRTAKVTVSCWRLRFVDQSAAEVVAARVSGKLRATVARFERDVIIMAATPGGWTPRPPPDQVFKAIPPPAPPPPPPTMPPPTGRTRAGIACPARAFRGSFGGAAMIPTDNP